MTSWSWYRQWNTSGYTPSKMHSGSSLLKVPSPLLLFLSSELSLVASLASSEGLDPILTDVYNDFNTALETFKSSTKVCTFHFIIHVHVHVQ